MTYRRTHVGTAALLFTLACSSQVEIGHGDDGGSGGKVSGTGGTANNDGGTDAIGEAGGDSEGGTSAAGKPPVTPTAGTTSSGGTAITGGPIPNDNGPQATVDKV